MLRIVALNLAPPPGPQRLPDAGRTVLLVNVPLTYPPMPTSAAQVIAGGVIPPNAVYLHPAATGPELRVADQRRIVDDVPEPRPPDLQADVERASWRRARGKPSANSSAVRSLGRGLRRLRLARPDPALRLLELSSTRTIPDYVRALATLVAERGARDVYRLIDRELGIAVVELISDSE